MKTKKQLIELIEWTYTKLNQSLDVDLTDAEQSLDIQYTILERLERTLDEI